MSIIRWVVRIILCLLVSALAGCKTDDSTPPRNHHVVAADSSPLADSPFSIQADSLGSLVFYTCNVNPVSQRIVIFNPDYTADGRTFQTALRAYPDTGRLIYVGNGGMYNSDFSAKGLLITDAKIIQPVDTHTTGYGNFYMQPNGIFGIDQARRAFIVTTQAYDTVTNVHPMMFATQSGPMLVRDSTLNTLFNPASANRHIRNAVGITSRGRVILALSAEEVTFYELASFMLSKGCHQALYLDGAVSQAYIPDIGIGNMGDGSGLGPLIVIYER